jgi:predicted nucleic acid-binding protein
MRKELEGDMAFDGGVVVELVYSTPSGREALKEIESEALRPFVTEITLAEARYVVCRKLGEIEANSRMKDFRESNFLTIEPLTPALSDYAAQYKCDRSLSLADSFTIALGKSKAIPVLFARKEKELEKEMKTKRFDIPIIFLEDQYAMEKE